MGVLIIYSDYSLLLEYICQSNGLSFLSYILGEKQLVTVHPTELSDVEFLSQIDVFGDNQMVDLIDITGVSSLNCIPAMAEYDIPLFFRGGELPTPAIKKLCEQSGISIINLTQTNQNTARDLISEYSKLIESEIPNVVVNKIINYATNYNQIISLVDIASMIKNEDFEEFVTIKPPIELFKLPLYKQSIHKDIKAWHELVTKDEVQLALSLLCTKLKKIASRTGVATVIKGDHLLKTSERIEYMNLYKYTLVKITQTV